MYIVIGLSGCEDIWTHTITQKHLYNYMAVRKCMLDIGRRENIVLPEVKAQQLNKDSCKSDTS